jgi:hypothetical protein
MTVLNLQHSTDMKATASATACWPAFKQQPRRVQQQTALPGRQQQQQQQQQLQQQQQQ